MPINLSKGNKVVLEKAAPGLKKLVVGLGWDVRAFSNGSDFDLDATCFLCGNDSKCPSDRDFVFYGNMKHYSGAVESTGDNRTGKGDGDDEQVKVDLDKIPDNIEKIAFAVSIYEAETRRQNFGQVSNSYIHVLNPENGEELIRYDLSEDFSTETAIVVGELYKHNGSWKFAAVGDGFTGGLEALCNHYGLSV